MNLPTFQRRRSRRWFPGRSTMRLWISATFVCFFVLMAVIGPWLYPFDPVATNLTARLAPPMSTAPDGTFYAFGTDQLGRDLLGQTIYGARVTLMVSVSVVVIGLVAGATLGVISGFVGGWVDMLIMRVVDVQLAIPPIILALLMVAVLGPGVPTLIIALSITRWVMFARVARGAALATANRPFVDAARISGLSRMQILFTHIARFTVSSLLVVATLQVGQVVLAEAAISFLGMGTSPTEPSWGLIISNGRGVLGIAWWISTIPGIALSLLVISVAVLGDELRDRTNTVDFDSVTGAAR